MKKNILFAIITFAIISCSNSVQLNQLYEESSIESWIILNYIKYDKKQTFDDLKALRKKSEQGLWLLILELPIDIEPPWGILKEINSQDMITIGKEY